MKRLWIIALVVMMIAFSIAWGQQLYVGTSHTVAWDEVYEEGTISYEVWLRDANGDTYFVAETFDTEYTVDISNYGGEMVVGVRTKQLLYDEMFYSEYNWSDVNGEETPNPFVLLPSSPVVPVPNNFRVIQ